MLHDYPSFAYGIKYSLTYLSCMLLSYDLPMHTPRFLFCLIRMVEADDGSMCGVFYHSQFDRSTEPPIFQELKKPNSVDDVNFVEHGDVCECTSPSLVRCKVTRVYTDGDRVRVRQCDEQGKFDDGLSDTHVAYKKDIKIMNKTSYLHALIEAGEMREIKVSDANKGSSRSSGSGGIGSGCKSLALTSRISASSPGDSAGSSSNYGGRGAGDVATSDSGGTKKKQPSVSTADNNMNVSCKKREPVTPSDPPPNKKQKYVERIFEERCVARFGKSGNILAIYESISDAISQTSFTRTQIMNYLAGKRGVNHCGGWGWKRPTLAEINKFRSSKLVVEEFELANGNVKRRFPSIATAAEELGIPASVMKDRCRDRFYQSPYGLGYNIVRMNTELVRRDPLMYRPHRMEAESIHSNEESETESPRTRRVNRRSMIGKKEVVNYWKGDIVQTRFGDGEIVDRAEVLPDTIMYRIKPTVSAPITVLCFHSSILTCKFY